MFAATITAMAANVIIVIERKRFILSRGVGLF